MTNQSLNQKALLLGEAIERNRQEIERCWLERVQREIVKRPGVELTQLRDGLPAYLSALAEQLSQKGAEPIETRAESAWSRVAREHGVTRVRIGFDIGQLVHEFIVLRQVIREFAERQSVVVEDPGTILVDMLEGAIAAAVQAYVDARNYDARRKRAEHIGFLTHELRNPLSTATLSASQLRRDASPEQRRILDVLDRSHRRLSDLIDGVLLSGKMDATKIDCRPVDLALGSVVEDAIEAARATAQKKGLGFHATYDPELRVRIDPGLTRSALQNIADNAAKYTDRGHVEVTIDARPDDVVIHVRDTCDGISEPELRTIFEPFERGARGAGKPGTGLGLAIARRAIEAQGGSVQAESPDNLGCHFWITLPKRVEQASAPGSSG